MIKFLLAILFSINAFAITGSGYDPASMASIEKGKVNFNGQKTSAIVTALTTQDIDLSLTDDHLLTGAKLILTGACDSDEIQLKIVCSGVVVNQFIDWYARDLEKELPYPAKINLAQCPSAKIRATYKNTCTSAVTVRINYFLHKITL